MKETSLSVTTLKEQMTEPLHQYVKLPLSHQFFIPGLIHQSCIYMNCDIDRKYGTDSGRTALPTKQHEISLLKGNHMLS